MISVQRTVYKNACVDGKITDITVENGVFSNFTPTALPGIDLKGARVYPGLIDIHSHGCVGLDATNDPDGLETMALYQAEHGITTWYPTTSTDEIGRLHRATSQKITGLMGANIPGFHMEGPYISAQKLGAMNRANLRPPLLAEFEAFEQVKLVTVAPELAGSEAFIRGCKAVVCLGHTVCDYETACSAADAGAKCVTHIFNAMPPLNHREPSLIGAAITKNMYVQVICDGIHIHPAVITALYRIFGSERMILISDSMAATGIRENGAFLFGGQTIYLKDGVIRTQSGALAGSASNLFDCVKKAIAFGISESEAFKMASETPAGLMGLKKGKLAIGFDADFLAVDSDLNLQRVVIGGETV